MYRNWHQSALSVLAEALAGWAMHHGCGAWLAYQFRNLAYAPALYLAPLCLAPQTRRANGNTRSLRALKCDRSLPQRMARVPVNQSIPATRLANGTTAAGRTIP